MNIPLEEVHRRQKLFCDTFLSCFLCKRRKYQNILIENGINLASGHSDFSINFKTNLNEEIDLILQNGKLTEQRLLKTRSSVSIGHIFRSIHRIIRRRKAVKILRHMNHVQEFEIRNTIEEVAHEISIAYEYQLLVLSGDEDIVTLAVYGVACILTYLRSSNAEFNSGKLLQAILEVKPENHGFKEHLKTRPVYHGDRTFCWRWKLSGILKQPGLCIRTRPSSAISVSLDVEEVIIRDCNNKESPRKSASDKGGEIITNNFDNKDNTEVICTNNSQILRSLESLDEKLLAHSTFHIKVNVCTDYSKPPMEQEFSKQGIYTEDTISTGKTDGLEVTSFPSSPSEIVLGNHDNGSTESCKPRHTCEDAAGDSEQIEYIKGDNSCLALTKEDHSNVRYILVQEFAHADNSHQQCDSNLIIKSGQKSVERHTYVNLGFESDNEIKEEKGLEDQSTCITNTQHCNQFGIKWLDVTCKTRKLGDNCENCLFGMASSLSGQKQNFSQKCLSDSLVDSFSSTESQGQITTLHSSSGKPSDIYCHPVEHYSKNYINVLEDQCKRYAQTVENQLEMYASAFENQSRKSATSSSLDCIRCENTQFSSCFKAVESEQNDQFEFYGCFTPWGFRCQPQIYGFRGPLHVMDEDTGKYTMIYNDLVSIEPSHGRTITYDPNNPHQAYVPKTLFADERLAIHEATCCWIFYTTGSCVPQRYIQFWPPLQWILTTTYDSSDFKGIELKCLSCDNNFPAKAVQCIQIIHANIHDIFPDHVILNAFTVFEPNNFPAIVSDMPQITWTL